MVSVYTDADYLAALKQKQRIFLVFLLVTGFYLATCIGMVVYHAMLPYAAKEDIIPQAVTYVCTAVYFGWMIPYMTIKFGRSRRYCKMLYYVSEGIKMEESNYFYTTREKNLQKDHIDVIGCVFETWSKKRQEWMEREVYFDIEMEKPDFGSGDYVRYISQSNFLVQYEIIERHAYEFSEEYDEDDEEEEDEEERETTGNSGLETEGEVQ